MIAGTGQGLDLSFNVSEPNIVPGSSYDPAGHHFPAALDEINHYSHFITALGGYWSADIKLATNRDRAEDWIFGGLNRHIEVFDHSLVKIFEGFVNIVEVDLGAVTIIRGPVKSIINKAILIYSTMDTSTSGPAFGMRVATDPTSDAYSQSLYGTLESNLVTGGSTEDMADDMLATILDENKTPKNTQTLTFPARRGVEVRIRCLGYVHRLQKYSYNQTTTTGEYDLSTKIADVIAAHPESLFPTGSIESNALQVPQWEDEDRSAWGIIKGLVAMGDASAQRYIFGVYADRNPVYEIAPTDVELEYSPSGADQLIYSRSGGLVKPWNVLPGRWIEFTDFLIGAGGTVDPRDDPSKMFIESTKYTAPDSIVLSGGKLDELPQQLAQMGLSGMG